jgi:hypothetical protein
MELYKRQPYTLGRLKRHAESTKDRLWIMLFRFAFAHITSSRDFIRAGFSLLPIEELKGFIDAPGHQLKTDGVMQISRKVVRIKPHKNGPQFTLFMDEYGDMFDREESTLEHPWRETDVDNLSAVMELPVFWLNAALNDLMQEIRKRRLDKITRTEDPDLGEALAALNDGDRK